MLTALAPFVGENILSLEDARAHLRLTSSDTHHDASVIASRDAAIAWVETYTGKSLQQRQFVWTARQFCRAMALPIGPITSIDAVEYYEADGTEVALVDGDWYLGDHQLLAAHGTSWPVSSGEAGSVRVTLTAGYAAADDIPADLMAALKLMMGHLFAMREGVAQGGGVEEVPFGITALAQSYRPIL